MISSQETLPESPLVRTNIISKVFFWWLNGFFATGNKRPLEIPDLYRTLPKDNCKRLGDGLATEWEKELQKNSSTNKFNGSPSLLKAIVREFGMYYMGVGMLVFVEECITRIAQPLFLGYLIRYFTQPEKFYERDGYLFAGAVVILSACYTFTHHPFFFGVQHTGMKIRVACCSLVYRKALRLSQSALGKTNVGQLTNLLANDVNRFDQCTIFLHYLWVGPIQTAIVTYILWGYYGPACLAGLLVLVLFVPFQAFCGKMFSHLRTETAGKTDKRIRILNEIVAGIRVIKMYTWEKPFAALVTESRKDEVKTIRKTSRLRALNYAVFYTSSKLVIFLTLLVYVLITEDTLTAEKVFVTVALYSNVRLAMTLFFPQGVSQLAETLVSIERLQGFLMMEERPMESPSPDTSDQNNSKGIRMDGLSAKWTPTHASPTLTSISLQVQPAQLSCVIGQVGSGKTSLLHAILKELPASTGTIEVNGTIAYASQEPWVFQGTVRDNILFGKPFEPDWYQDCVAACALERDMTLFPFGDQTLVGDRGSSLSGGQKARITLARAVYSNADIYLLDDPLSAVDAEVGRWIFEKCICGILAEKARVLVTHQLQFLKGEGVDQIMLLNGGKVQAQGNYVELLKCGIDFAQLLDLDSKESGDASKKKDNRRLSKGSDTDLPSSNIAGQEIRRGSLTVALPDTLIPDFVEEEIYEDKPKDIEGSPPKVVEEATKTGGVRWSTYWKYYGGQGSGYLAFGLLILFNVVTQILFTGADWWLNFWTKTQREGYKVPVQNSSAFYPIYTNKDIQVYTYTGIVVGLFIASMARTLLFFSICMSASVNLHNGMFQGIIRAPMNFFEVNPIGRLLNRMTKDVGIIDELLPQTSFDTMEIFLNVIGILVIVGVVNPLLLIPSGVLLVVFYFLRGFYLKTARSVKRLEGIARSPVYSHLSTSLYGLTTIRAFQAEDELCQQFDIHQDLHTSSWFLFISTTRWLGIWVDWLSVVYIAVVTFSFMLFSTDGAQVGLAVSSAMMLTGMFQFGVHQSAEVENQMVSVERVLEYSKIESEAALESEPDKKPPPTWPSKGEISLKSIELKYGAQDKPVLSDISLIFKSREKVGIVGRTGAGKSSLITVLYRLAEPSSNGGIIEIDDVNVLQIGLHDLRSKISIIPQDPVLFTGTLRKNLDPFGDFGDSEIWAVLKECHLDEEVAKQAPAGILEVEVTEGGGNFSVGQRQLVCLARAILRKNQILVLDEATANVDPETDALIQKTIRSKFKDCTVLTVAHRLHTVMDSDKILVLDAGRIKEYDEPFNLLENKESALYSLVQQTGANEAENLYRIAKQAHFTRSRNLSSGLSE